MNAYCIRFSIYDWNDIMAYIKAHSYLHFCVIMDADPIELYIFISSEDLSALTLKYKLVDTFLLKGTNRATFLQWKGLFDRNSDIVT